MILMVGKFLKIKKIKDSDKGTEANGGEAAAAGKYIFEIGTKLLEFCQRKLFGRGKWQRSEANLDAEVPYDDHEIYFKDEREMQS